MKESKGAALAKNPPKEDATIVSLQHVGKSFDGVAVVEDFNLEVKQGEFITILGPSGCGKTTTLRMIAGFELPSKGKILLNGADISLLAPYKRPVNTVFQHYALFPHLDVYDNVAFGLKLKKVAVPLFDKKGQPILDKKSKQQKVRYKHLSPREIDLKVSRALQIVDLDEMEDRDVSTLSGGQQQRVAIARAIVNEPKVLLLDEPLSALDHKMRKDMQIELKEMHKKLGITFFYVTHDQEEALTMSDRILVMKDGVIQQVGTPEDIYNEPVNAFVADFIGESNIYNGTMIGHKKVRFIGAAFPCVDDFPLNEKVDVVVRPEDFLIVEEEKGAIKGTIVSKIFQGVHYGYIVQVGKSEVSCRDTRSYELGATVGLRVEPANIQVMHKDVTQNEYDDALLTGKGTVIIGADPFEADFAQLVPNGRVQEDGTVLDLSSKKRYDFSDAVVRASIALDKVELSDDLGAGQAQGTIIEVVWIGDHYRYIVRTDDDEDFIVASAYSWNENDLVAISVKKEDIVLKLKKDLDEYAIEE